MGPGTSEPRESEAGSKYKPEPQPTCAFLDLNNANTTVVNYHNPPSVYQIVEIIHISAWPEGCGRRGPATWVIPDRNNKTRMHTTKDLGRKYR